MEPTDAEDMVTLLDGYYALFVAPNSTLLAPVAPPVPLDFSERVESAAAGQDELARQLQSVKLRQTGRPGDKAGGASSGGGIDMSIIAQARQRMRKTNAFRPVGDGTIIEFDRSQLKTNTSAPAPEYASRHRVLDYNALRGDYMGQMVDLARPPPKYTAASLESLQLRRTGIDMTAPSLQKPAGQTTQRPQSLIEMPQLRKGFRDYLLRQDAKLQAPQPPPVKPKPDAAARLSSGPAPAGQVLRPPPPPAAFGTASVPATPAPAPALGPLPLQLPPPPPPVAFLSAPTSPTHATAPLGLLPPPPPSLLQPAPSAPATGWPAAPMPTPPPGFGQASPPVGGPVLPPSGFRVGTAPPPLGFGGSAVPVQAPRPQPPADFAPKAADRNGAPVSRAADPAASTGGSERGVRARPESLPVTMVQGNKALNILDSLMSSLASEGSATASRPTTRSLDSDSDFESEPEPEPEPTSKADSDSDTDTKPGAATRTARYDLTTARAEQPSSADEEQSNGEASSDGDMPPLEADDSNAEDHSEPATAPEPSAQPPQARTGRRASVEEVLAQVLPPPTPLAVREADADLARVATACEAAVRDLRTSLDEIHAALSLVSAQQLSSDDSSMSSFHQQKAAALDSARELAKAAKSLVRQTNYSPSDFAPVYASVSAAAIRLSNMCMASAAAIPAGREELQSGVRAAVRRAWRVLRRSRLTLRLRSCWSRCKTRWPAWKSSAAPVGWSSRSRAVSGRRRWSS